MVRYFYQWMPLVIVGTVVLLSLPWLGLIALIALILVSLVALAALGWAIVAVSYVAGRAINHRWQARRSASPRTAAVVSPANSGVRRVRSGRKAAVLLANPPAEKGDVI